MDTPALPSDPTAIFAGISSAFAEKRWDKMVALILTALFFVADWVDVLRFFPSGTARQIAATVLWTLMVGCGALYTGSGFGAAGVAALGALISSWRKPPRAILERFDTAADIAADDAANAPKAPGPPS